MRKYFLSIWTFLEFRQALQRGLQMKLLVSILYERINIKSQKSEYTLIDIIGWVKFAWDPYKIGRREAQIVTKTEILTKNTTDNEVRTVLRFT